MRGESNLPKKVENKNDEILNKLEYLGLDLDKLPKAIILYLLFIFSYTLVSPTNSI